VRDEFIIPTYNLTLKAAERMIAAAVARAEELSVSVCIVVVDGGANLLGYARMDGARTSAEKSAVAKAVTAASIGGETGQAPFELGLQLAIATGGQWTNLKAGTPVVYAGHVIVGGASIEQDIDISQAAVTTLGFSTTYLFDALPPADLALLRRYRNYGRVCCVTDGGKAGRDALNERRS
jgi:glc operon protein GlcG